MPVTERTLRRILTPFEANAIIVLAAHRGNVDDARIALSGRKAMVVEDENGHANLQMAGGTGERLPNRERFDAAIESARRKIAEYVKSLAVCSKHGEYTDRGRGCPACSTRAEGGGERPRPVGDPTKHQPDPWPTWAPPNPRRPKRKRGEEARQQSEQAARRRSGPRITEVSSEGRRSEGDDVTLTEERVAEALRIIVENPGIRAADVRDRMGLKGPAMSGDIMPRLKRQGVTTGAMVNRSPQLFPPAEGAKANGNGPMPAMSGFEPPEEERPGALPEDPYTLPPAMQESADAMREKLEEPDEERQAASAARARFEVEGAADGEVEVQCERCDDRAMVRESDGGYVVSKPGWSRTATGWRCVRHEGERCPHGEDVGSRCVECPGEVAGVRSAGDGELAEARRERAEAEERAAELAGEVETLRTELNTAAESLLHAKAEVERFRSERAEAANAWENGRRGGVAEGEALGTTNARDALVRVLYVLATEDPQTLASLAVAIDTFETEREFGGVQLADGAMGRLARALAERVLPL